jgi:two-component SAPR family response regulator
MLKISLLGKTKIEYAGDDLTGKLGTKAVAMIYLLIANKGRYVPKDKLMLYLWRNPEIPVRCIARLCAFRAISIALSPIVYKASCTLL